MSICTKNNKECKFHQINKHRKEGEACGYFNKIKPHYNDIKHIRYNGGIVP